MLHPAKLTRMASIMEPSWIETINVPSCPNSVHQPQHNRVWMMASHAESMMASHWHYHGWGHSQDLWDHQSTTIGGGYLSTKGSFTGDRWAQLTPLVNIMTHTTFTQSKLSVSSAIVNPLFFIMSKRAGETFAASANAKQKRVHCTAIIARKLTLRMPIWTITQYLHQITKLEVRFDDPANKFSLRIRRNRNSTRWYCAASVHNLGRTPTDLRYFAFNIAIWSQFTSDCLLASFWLSKDHEDFKRMAMNEVSQEHKI